MKNNKGKLAKYSLIILGLVMLCVGAVIYLFMNSKKEEAKVVKCTSSILTPSIKTTYIYLTTLVTYSPVLTYDDETYLDYIEVSDFDTNLHAWEISAKDNINFNDRKSIKIFVNLQNTVKYDFNIQISNDITDVETNTEASIIQEYIYTRTLSIGRLSQSYTSGCLGTAWFVGNVDDATNEYTYYIATNWHVKLGFDEMESNFKYYFGSSDNLSGINKIFTKFETFNWENEGNFEINSDKKNAIDLYVAKVSFDYDKLHPDMKTKLKFINSLDGNINQYKNINNSSDTTNKYYIGGYPAEKYGFNPHWEFYSKTFDCYIDNQPHSINDYDDDDPKAIIDKQPQIMMKECNSKQLSGGSSGSMCIEVDYTEKKIYIVGIYWGGWSEYENSPKIQHCVSILKSANKFWLENYVN